MKKVMVLLAIVSVVLCGCVMPESNDMASSRSSVTNQASAEENYSVEQWLASSELESSKEVASSDAVSSKEAVASEAVPSKEVASSEAVPSKEVASSEAVPSKEAVSSEAATSDAIKNDSQQDIVDGGQATQGKTVLITETGKKYHLKACGKGKYFPCALEEALKMGLEPCARCY